MHVLPPAQAPGNRSFEQEHDEADGCECLESQRVGGQCLVGHERLSARMRKTGERHRDVPVSEAYRLHLTYRARAALARSKTEERRCKG